MVSKLASHGLRTEDSVVEGVNGGRKRKVCTWDKAEEAPAAFVAAAPSLQPFTSTAIVSKVFNKHK